MAREFFDYDPITGMTEYLEFTDNGKFHITSEQDVEPVLDYTRMLANTGGTEHGFKSEGWLYAVIPPVVQSQLFAKGINFLDKNDTKKLLSEINSNYQYCKTTHRHHGIK
jgi:hypothetical protein